MSGRITDIDGILIGHYTDTEAMTGCTAVIPENGAVCGVDVRGSAPGTRETDLLRGYNAVDKINAIMLSGGSAYGLDAASGAMQWMEEHQRGVNVGVGVVPIVPGAVIFDLDSGRHDVRPTRQNGYEACENAAKAFETGNVGAGTGATVGKAYGHEYCAKGGLGTACIDIGRGIKVGAIIVVNALGDIYDPKTGRIIAGAHKNGEFLPCMDSPALSDLSFGNTTIGVVATNAALTREEANKLASMAHDGLAMTIRPVHTSMDGDTIFAMSTMEREAVPMLPLMVAAVKAVSAAILDAVGFDNPS